MLNKWLLDEWLKNLIHYHTDLFMLFAICFVILPFLHKSIINNLNTEIKSYIFPSFTS